MTPPETRSTGRVKRRFASRAAAARTGATAPRSAASPTRRDGALFTTSIAPVTVIPVSASTAAGEAVLVSQEMVAVQTVFDRCGAGDSRDELLRAHNLLHATALSVIADGYWHDQPAGWREMHGRIHALIELICDVHQIRLLTDVFGDGLLCAGGLPLIWQGQVGRPLGGVVWSAGSLPCGIDEFAAPRSLAQEMERAAFLDTLHRRALTGEEPGLDPEQVGLLRAGAWSRLGDRGLERRLLTGEGVAVLTFHGVPRAAIGRVAPADGRESLADMTVSQRIRWISELTRELPGRLGELAPLPAGCGVASDGSGLRPLREGDRR